LKNSRLPEIKAKAYITPTEAEIKAAAISKNVALSPHPFHADRIKAKREGLRKYVIAVGIAMVTTIILAVIWCFFTCVPVLSWGTKVWLIAALFWGIFISHCRMECPDSSPLESIPAFINGIVMVGFLRLIVAAILGQV